MSKIKKALRTVFMLEIAEGMALTLKTMLTVQSNSVLFSWWPLRKKVGDDTRQYPTYKRKPFAGSRGLHYMDRDDTGQKERCIGCGLCEAVCPAKAITVVTAKGQDNEKVVTAYELDLLRCVFCGFCVDACPVNAIKMTPNFELACYSRKDVFFTKERLVEVGDRYLGRKPIEGAK